MKLAVQARSVVVKSGKGIVFGIAIAHWQDAWKQGIAP